MLRFLGAHWAVTFALLGCTGAPQERAERCDAGAAGVQGALLQLEPSDANAIVAVGSRGKLLCSGVLVRSDAVVTAKHCVKDATSAPLSVRVGREFACPVQTFGVAAVSEHPTLDVALLRLADDTVGLATPIAWSSDLPRELSVGDAAEGAGFGRAQGTLGSRRFVATTVTELAEDIVVNGGEEPGLCAGDSGAPLLGRSHAGNLTIWGTLRGGSPACDGRDRFVRADEASEWLVSQ
jgi:hypothetical protein